jgi:hypothetical protein
MGEQRFDLGVNGEDATTQNAPDQFQGYSLSPAVTTGHSMIDASIDTLFNADDPAAKVIHQSSQDPLACGELAGFVRDGQVAVSIRPLDGSGFYGVAVFSEDSQSGQTSVTTYVFKEQGPAGPSGLGATLAPNKEG